MGLNLNSLYQSPYVMRDGKNLVRKKQDDDAAKKATQAEQEERANSQARSKGLQYVEEAKNQYVTSHNNITPTQSQRAQHLYGQYVQNAGAETVQRPQTVSNMTTPRSTSINIAQILKDFKNTAVAIGTPAELSAEIDNRIGIIKAQVSKENPDIALVKADLMNASKLLDKYISATLNKDSKVVENWVGALFLQDIDFKYNEGDVNPQFLVKFPEGSTDQQPKSQVVAEKPVYTEVEVKSSVVNPVQEDEAKTKVYIPQDKELKSLFLQSKKLAYAHEPQKAIKTFQKALVRANEVGDTETGAKIYFEVGKIYDDYDYLPQALKSYNQSINQTTDYNVKTKAHYSMAQIYDDANQVKPALDHYYSSVAYGGEGENLAAQSTSLAKMGKIYTDMYENDALDYLTVADELAAETDNAKVKGFVSSTLAKAYDRFGEPQEALRSYSKAVQHYSDAKSPLKAAQNYMDAAEIMIDYGCNNKAKGLLEKAKIQAINADNQELAQKISQKIANLVA
ncbi:hypothetical protein IKU74_00635 [bacterium]|nr:hypothetical protein [bacterium]